MDSTIENPAFTYKFENFFELSPDLLCIAGFDGYLKRINPAVSRTLGYSADELMSYPIAHFVHPEDLELTVTLRQRAMDEEYPLINFENRYLTKAGEIVWLSWTSMPVKNEQLIYAIAKNITGKKTLDSTRNHYLTQLMQVNKDLKQLTYTTSHDLRSPVNNLLSIFDLIDLERIKDHETEQYITLLKEATENLSKILNTSVDHLLHKDRLSVPVEELDLNENVQGVLRSIHSTIKATNARIDTNFTACPVIKFNKAYLESIFLNLITNSIKYSRMDAPPHIMISSYPADGRNHIAVSDNGQGFDLEKVGDKLFGLNQTFHNHSDSKGVGLYLVYNHVTSLGGQIEVSSEVNQGTTFTISLKA